MKIQKGLFSTSTRTIPQAFADWRLLTHRSSTTPNLENHYTTLRSFSSVCRKCHSTGLLWSRLPRLETWSDLHGHSCTYAASGVLAIRALLNSMLADMLLIGLDRRQHVLTLFQLFNTWIRIHLMQVLNNERIGAVYLFYQKKGPDGQKKTRR